MRIWRSATALLVSTSLLLGGPALADSGGVTGGDVSVPNTVPADDLCVDIPISYDLSMMDTTYSWTLELASTSTGGAFDFGDGGDSSDTDALWCPSDLPGTFTLTGTLTVQDSSFEQVAVDPVSLSFTVRRRTTYSTIHTSKARPVAGKALRIRGCVSSSGHRDDYRDLYVQQRRPGGGWHVLSKTYTDDVGCYSETKTFKQAGKRYLRAFVPGTHSRMADYSSATVVRVTKPKAKKAKPSPRSTNYRPGQYCARVDRGDVVSSSYGLLRCSQYPGGEWRWKHVS